MKRKVDATDNESSEAAGKEMRYASVPGGLESKRTMVTPLSDDGNEDAFAHCLLIRRRSSASSSTNNIASSPSSTLASPITASSPQSTDGVELTSMWRTIPVSKLPVEIINEMRFQSKYAVQFANVERDEDALLSHLVSTIHESLSSFYSPSPKEYHVKFVDRYAEPDRIFVHADSRESEPIIVLNQAECAFFFSTRLLLLSLSA